MTTTSAALADLVTRHNTAEASVIQRLAERDATIEELRRQLKAARAELAELRLKADAAPLFKHQESGVEVQRPAVTIKDYCQTTGSTYMQVYRALRGEIKGHKLEGYQDRFNHWWVYTA